MLAALVRKVPVMAALMALAGCVTDEPEERVAVGDPLPQFAVVLDTGETVTTELLLGRPGAIVFFNTACSDCRRELPEIQKYYESVDSGDFRLICIAREENAESIADYWKTHNLTMPYSPQPDRSVFTLFASQGIPRIYVFNAHGIITSATL